MSLASGTIYDLFGRKPPMLVFVFISCIAYSSLPFLESVFELYLFSILEIPVGALISNPFIPDLISEESHGVANMLRTNAINLANLSAYGLLLLNATNLPMFSSDMIFFFVAFILVATGVLVYFGMKDVIREGNRMTESVSQEVTASYVIKQAFNTVISEPILTLGISGSVIQLMTKFVGGVTTTLVI